MSMFDNIRCKYPFPTTTDQSVLQSLEYQTKDTPAQFLDNYEIREDGTLWHETYDMEDHSKAATWLREHPGMELPPELDNIFDRIGGSLSRVNQQWQPEPFTGEIRFYYYAENPVYDYVETEGAVVTGWIEWSAYFIDGQIKQFVQVKGRQ